MAKGDETRTRAVNEAGRLMNRTGYLSTPLSALLPVVALQKGGFYHHFPSKEALASEAFLANVSQLGRYLSSVTREGDDPLIQLRALIEASVAVAEDRVVPGGCPVLNGGTEADDASEDLRGLAANALEALRQRLLGPLRQLEAANRLRESTDVEGLSWMLMAGLEGGILIRRVTKTSASQALVLSTLWSCVQSFLNE